MKVNVYIDGFNLYYGALAGRPYKWLDVALFSAQMLQSGDEINRIRYCTALVDGLSDPDAPTRQRIYLRALRTIPDLEVHEGSFLTIYPWMRPAAGGPRVQVRRREEKGSDVNLASYLLIDAYESRFDVALVVSNDSDLVTPIEHVTRRLGKPVGVAMPLLNAGRVAGVELQSVGSFTRFVTDTGRWRRRLLQSQFPPILSDADGTFSKPPKWDKPPY